MWSIVGEYTKEEASSPVDSEFEQLRERSQRNLVAFLTTELDLALGFAQRNHENFERCREYAERALEVVDQFSARVVSSEMRQQLQERANELQKAVSSLWPRPN
jgi:hypothetical protein